MKIDEQEVWKARGARFEVFRPKAEQVRPSEWWVPIYAVGHPWILWGKRSRPGWLGGGNKAEKRRGRWFGWWRGKMGRVDEKQGEGTLEDQPWVL